MGKTMKQILIETSVLIFFPHGVFRGLRFSLQDMELKRGE